MPINSCLAPIDSDLQDDSKGLRLRDTTHEAHPDRISDPSALAQLRKYYSTTSDDAPTNYH